MESRHSEVAGESLESHWKVVIWKSLASHWKTTEKFRQTTGRSLESQWKVIGKSPLGNHIGVIGKALGSHWKDTAKSSLGSHWKVIGTSLEIVIGKSLASRWKVIGQCAQGATERSLPGRSHRSAIVNLLSMLSFIHKPTGRSSWRYTYIWCFFVCYLFRLRGLYAGDLLYFNRMMVYHKCIPFINVRIEVKSGTSPNNTHGQRHNGTTVHVDVGKNTTIIKICHVERMNSLADRGNTTDHHQCFQRRQREERCRYYKTTPCARFKQLETQTRKMRRSL